MLASCWNGGPARRRHVLSCCLRLLLLAFPAPRYKLVLGDGQVLEATIPNLHTYMEGALQAGCVVLATLFCTLLLLERSGMKRRFRSAAHL